LPQSPAAAAAPAALAVLALHYSVKRSRFDVECGLRGIRTKSIWAALILMLIVAAGLRLAFIDTYPPGLNIDSAYNGVATLNILNGDPYSPYTHERYGRETLCYYFTVPFFWALGPERRALHAASVALDLLACVAVFLFGWRRFSPLVGIGAGVFLAASPLQITFARSANVNNASPLLAMLLCSWGLLAGLSSMKLRHFTLAGLMLGLGFHTYKNFKYFAPLPILFLLAQLLSRRGRRRRLTAAMALLLASAALTALPIILYVWENPYAYVFREHSILHQESGGGSWISLWLSNIPEVFKSFLQGTRRCGPLLRPGQPYLAELEGTLVVLGLALSLIRMARTKDRNLVFLWLWMGQTLAIGIGSSPAATHILPIWGPFALFVGMALEKFASTAAAVVPKRPRTAALAVYVPLMAGLCVQGGYQYFVVEQQNEAVVFHYNVPDTVISEYVRTIAGTHAVYLSPFLADHDCVRFLNYYQSGYAEKRQIKSYAQAFRRFEPQFDVPLPTPECRPTAVVVIVQDRTPLLDQEFLGAYPNVRIERHRETKAGMMVDFTVYFLDSPDFPKCQDTGRSGHPPGAAEVE